MKCLFCILLLAGCSNGNSAKDQTPRMVEHASPKLAGSPSSPMVAIPNARVVNGLLLGGQPSAAMLQEAKTKGYRKIINLQVEAEPGALEVRRTASELGLSYVALPIRGGAGMTEENARALDAALRSDDGPTMITCASGNRVGALLALRAYHVQGAAPSDAYQLGLDAGMTSLAPLVKKLLGL